MFLNCIVFYQGFSFFLKKEHRKAFCSVFFVGSVLSTDPNVNKLRSVGRHGVKERYVHKDNIIAQTNISISLP